MGRTLPWIAMMLALLVATQAKGQDHGIAPYKQNMILTTWQAGDPDDRQSKELKLAFGIQKELAADTGVYLAYSQKFFWQIYDHCRSEPFRETNYNPEIFWRHANAAKTVGVQVGIFEHESNGKGSEYQVNGRSTISDCDPPPSGSSATLVQLSRAWNRSYVQPEFTFGESWKAKLSAKLWYVWSANNNEDIQNYLGPGELWLEMLSPDQGGNYPNTRMLLFFRKGYNLNTETYEFDLERQVGNDGWYLRLHYFQGYGESLIDYNKSITKAGIGVSLH